MIRGSNNFNTVEEADKYFADLGFKKYNSYKSDVVCEYQKKFCDDDNNVKYFVNASLWDFKELKDKFGFNYSAEFDGQFYKKGDHDAFNITFIYWNYEKVVEFIENMFNVGLLENYDDDV